MAMNQFPRNSSQRGGYSNISHSPDSLGNLSSASLPPGRSPHDSDNSLGYGNGIRPAFSKGLGSTLSNGSLGSMNHRRFAGQGPGMRQVPSMSSISNKFSLSPDPVNWGTPLNMPEPDDALHAPDAKEVNEKGSIFTARGLQNLGCLFILIAAFMALFAGYPIITYLLKKPLSTMGGFNIGGVNASGQLPSMVGNHGLIDLETPKDAYTHTSYSDPRKEFQLVFSDEFNTDGRSFYPGDDPYWEAVDMNYYSTGNLEWLDPSAITTKNGSLVITMTNENFHDLDYKSGMMSTWNKFCFTGGLIVARVVLPGASNVMGLWPAIWTMGNLGRAGYGATLEGMWPYTYDACDVGTVANQTINGQPLASTIKGDTAGNGGVLSYLQGQRLSRCTCPGESHPGPIHSDGTYVGRSAPEIDVLEAIVGNIGGINTGQVSQSSQWAPFNHEYTWDNSTNNMKIFQDVTELNQYAGGAFQQAISALSTTNQDCYEQEKGCYEVYGFEYRPGYDDGYIGWILNNKYTFEMRGASMAADPIAEVHARPVPQEPMYIIVNVGISHQFGLVDTKHLKFPTSMYVDYIRVYQLKDSINVGCDPENFPTAAYINEYLEAYTNPNLTTWRDDFKQPFPKNKFLGEC